MEPLQEKLLGSFVGMAVGDAMGLAARGLKPETIRQYFSRMDGYKEVRQFIGKGIRQYKMQGLYGAQTQSALVVCESLLKNRKIDINDISRSLQELAAEGPENNLGVFRHTEGPFWKTVQSLPHRRELIPAEQNDATCNYAVMGVPIALYHHRDEARMLRGCIETGLLMSKNPCEVVGLALTGFLTARFLALEPVEDGEPMSDDVAHEILNSAVEFSVQAQGYYTERYPELVEEFGEASSGGVATMLQDLCIQWQSPVEELKPWIAERAAKILATHVAHPSQGQVLTLLPLALVVILKSSMSFESILTHALNLGRAADKLGSITGAWAGALLGIQSIPETWVSGLVNGREIRLRAEALANRRFPKGLKDLRSMEFGLTIKEFDEGKKYLPKGTKKPTKKTVKPGAFFDEESLDSVLPGKEDTASWRKFHKDKTRMKRDRRRNLKRGDDDEAE
jgi:ADP-ribosylglycohydrolase